MISRGIVVNYFVQIRLILEARFGENPEDISRRCSILSVIHWAELRNQ